MYIELGALIVKTLLCLKIKDSRLLSIGKDLVDFTKSLGLNHMQERGFMRSFEAIGDEIAISCQNIVERMIPEPERQEVIIDLVLKVFVSACIDSKWIVEVKRDSENLTKKLEAHSKQYHEVIDLDPSEQEIFHSLLHHISTIIINCFNQFPEMSAERAQYLMNRLDSLVDESKTILSSLKSIENKINNLPEKYQNFERQYRKNLITQYSYIQLYGVDDIGEQMKRYKLSTAYVQLQVEIELKDEFEEYVIDVDDIFFYRQKNIWLSGEAGSGKTTCLSWIAIQAASNAKIKGLLDVVPIMIELRSMNMKNLSILDCINKVMTNSTYSIPEGWLESRIEQGRILFLIDGFDEISKSERSHVFQWISSIDSENKCHKLFTSRPQITDRPADIPLTEVKLLPMKMKQIEEFILYWHNTVLRDGLQYSDADVMVLRKNLISQIRNNASLQKLATNPLLCAIISALHSKSGMVVPNSRRELYESCCKMLLESRDSEKKIIRCGVVLSYEHKKRIMAKLAYHMMRNNQVEIDKKDVIKVLNVTLEDMNLVSQSVDDLLKFLIERTGLIHEPVLNKISFVHRSFQEYLCAVEMSRQEDWKYAEEKIVNDNWLETICLLIGMGNKDHANRIISETLKLGTNNRKCLFYALEYLSGAIDVDPKLRMKVEEQLKNYIPPKYEQIESIARAQNMAVPYLTNKQEYSKSDRNNCLLTLLSIGTMEALKCAIHYLDDKTSSNEIAHIGQLLELFPMDAICDELIPDALCDYYSKYSNDMMRVSMGTVRCLNMCHDSCIKEIVPFLSSKLLWSDMTDFDQSEYDEYDPIALIDTYSIPRAIAAKMRSIEIHGQFNSLILLRDFTNLKELIINSSSKDFDIYALNEYKDSWRLDKCDITLQSERPFINGIDLNFMKHCKEINMTFLGHNAEVSFEHFYNFNKLQTLSIAAEYASEFDYSGLFEVTSLKKLIIKCSEDYFICPTSLWDAPFEVEMDHFDFLEDD